MKRKPEILALYGINRHVMITGSEIPIKKQATGL
jgi:hypothetical protein